MGSGYSVKKLRKIFGVIFGLICIFFILGTLITIKEADNFATAIFIIIAAIFGYLSYRCLTKSIGEKYDKAILENYDEYVEEKNKTPPEVIETLKNIYDDEILNDVLKTIQECIDAMKNTSNPSIVLDRYEYGTIKAYHLRQLEEAGIYNGSPTASDYINWFHSNKSKCINEALERAKLEENDGDEEVYLHRKQTYFTEEEQELCFKFLMEHRDYIKKLEDEFYQVWLKQDEEKTIDDKIVRFKLSLDKLYQIRDFCISSDRGGEVYYIQRWEELFNSKNPCFSQEEIILERIKYYQKKKERLELLEKASKDIEKTIESKGPIYQKDLYKLFPELKRQEIQDIVNDLANKNIISKVKKGNSYELKIIK